MIGKLRPEDLRVISSTSQEVAAQRKTSGDASLPRSASIDVRNATLQYPLGAYIRGSLKANLMGLLGRKEKRIETPFIDALKGVSLSVHEGERVGIVGGNGSGKSSFLRALAGVYPLATGSIQIVGQIGTLLDIGLGFEVEATGRENIYYRGMTMGYSRLEIAEVEEHIVRFADLGSFIDLPMLTYSSGMYVRLGFAVSTQFTPDVLLIDEVFGAGDAAFSEKAVQRMLNMFDAAGIVMLATHDLPLVERLCTRAIWINRGNLVCDGPPAEVLQRFSQFMASGVA